MAAAAAGSHHLSGKGEKEEENECSKVKGCDLPRHANDHFLLY